MSTLPVQQSFTKLVELDDDLLLDPPGILYALLPQDTCRYDRKTTEFVQQGTMPITPGIFSYGKEPEPQYLPPQWSAHIHPEGQLYFRKKEQELCIVTDLNVQSSDNMLRLQAWLRKVLNMLKNSTIMVTDQTELFILPWKENCFYYFVDYRMRTTFFLETEDSCDMGLGYVASQSHLKISLEGQFWAHVENFPMHRGGIPVQYVDDLINILCHAHIDLSTSSVSTFCYTHEQLRDYMNILKISRENIRDGHQTCLVARLWRAMFIHRFLTHYGQDKARLSRNQLIAFPQHEGNGSVDKILSLLTVNASNYYLLKLNDVHADQIAYTTTWQAFCKQSLSEWQDVIQMAFAAMMLHLFFLAFPAHSFLGVVSFSLFGASLFTALLLTTRFRACANKHATFAHQYLANLESKTVGFRWPAFVLAVPYALFVWGIGISCVNCLYLVQEYFGTKTAVGLLMFSLVSFIGFQYSTMNTQSARSWISHIFRREKSASEMV